MGVYSTKQYLIICKDLGMRKGKIAAQATHASIGAFLSNSKDHAADHWNKIKSIELNEDFDSWLNGSFVKVALAVDSEEELLKCYKISQENNLLCSYIVDNVTTVFHNAPTPICVDIGPAKSEVLEPLFSHLKLF